MHSKVPRVANIETCRPVNGHPVWLSSWSRDEEVLEFLGCTILVDDNMQLILIIT